MTTQDRPDSARQTADGRTAYFVLGMHRSGTSATTQVLAAAGCQLPENVMPGDEHNAKGYFEPWKIAILNDERLRIGGSAWDDAFAYPFRPLPRKDERAWLNRATELFDTEYRFARFPLMKDPRASVLMPFWRTVLDDLGFGLRAVIPVRHPLAVAGSLARRDNFSTEKSLLIWTSYMLGAEAYTRDVARAFVSYDGLLSDWRAEVAKIEAAHGAPLPSLGAHSAEQIDSFLSPDLRHNAGSGDLGRFGWAGDLTARVLAWFEAAAAGEAPAASTLDALAAEYADWRAKVERLVSPMTRDFDVTRAELRHQRAVEVVLRNTHEREKADWKAHEVKLDLERETLLRNLRIERETMRLTLEHEFATERQQLIAERVAEREALEADRAAVRAALEADIVRIDAERQAAEQALEAMRRRWEELTRRLDSLLAET
ncbi:sulfotransferase family protein [Phenylobacterium sp. J367]|uniref:sulfotransferase family protein n=1 Tax=Phenylobacterium sp. J367 TaxID=2898435 RepID=UPI002150D6DC|nr:hypothetical protein [Phenylobacterium sp. J367]MCR5877545.1 hypothetical protein [Phenylobacterium sp. J367]